MSLTKQLKEKIFHLDVGERIKLVKELLESLEADSPDNNIDGQSSWIREAQIWRNCSAKRHLCPEYTMKNHE